MKTIIQIIALALIALALGCSKDNGAKDPNNEILIATSLSLVSGDGQMAIAETALANPI